LAKVLAKVLRFDIKMRCCEVVPLEGVAPGLRPFGLDENCVEMMPMPKAETIFRTLWMIALAALLANLALLIFRPALRPAIGGETVAKVCWHAALGLLLFNVCLYFGKVVWATYQPARVPSVIKPFQVSGGTEDAAKRGATLAHLLSGRLAEIGKEIRASEQSLEEAQSIKPQVVAFEGREASIRPIDLPTDVFRPLDLTMSVANVEVGKLVGWVHGWLAEDNSLSLSVVYTGDKAVATGRLKGRSDEMIWVEGPGNDDLQLISDLAYAIAQKPYAVRYPELEYLKPRDFGALLGSLHRVANLSRKAPRIGVTAEEYGDEYKVLEPLLRLHLPKWRPLLRLVADLGERSDRTEEALALYKQLLALYDLPTETEDRNATTKKIDTLNSKLLAASATPIAAATSGTEPTTKKIRATLHIPADRPPHFRRPLIAITGAAPAPGILPLGVQSKILKTPKAEKGQPDQFLIDHVGRLVASIQMVLPEVDFVFVQMDSRDGAMSLREISTALTVMLKSDPLPDIILHPYGGGTGNDPLPQNLIENVLAQDILLVLPAGNNSESARSPLPAFLEGSALGPGRPLRKQIAVAAAADFDGKPAAFTQRDAEVLWAPGVEIDHQSGTSFSAALTAGAAAWIKATHPDIKPANIVAVLQETSRAGADPVVKIIDVQAALEKLAAANHP
jgi:hypothetical protein